MEPLENKRSIKRKLFTRNSELFFVFTILLAIAFITGCEKEYYVKPVVVIDTTKVVSFNNDIMPLFTADCISCHKAGATPPDLTTANAFSSLNSTGMIDTTNAELSLLYQRINKSGPKGSTKGIMPPAGKWSDDKIALVLKWIDQGAKNN